MRCGGKALGTTDFDITQKCNICFRYMEQLGGP